METAADGAGLPAEDTATPPARVAMETTKLLVGGGGDPVTSSAGASRDYGGAQQLSTPVQRDDDGTYYVALYTFTGHVARCN